MPVTEASKIQEDSGTHFGGTTFDVTLPSGTTAGNTIIVFMDPSTDIVTPPSASWVTDSNLRIYRLSDVAAGQGIAGSTPFTFTATLADVVWYVVEMSDLDSVDPLDVSASTSASTGNGGTLATPTTARTASLNTVAFAMFETAKAAGDTVSWDGYTNGFEEINDQSAGSGAAGVSVAVAWKFVEGTTDTYQTTGTFATTGSAVLCTARIFAYRAADAPLAAPLAHIMGFDWGTHGGMGNGTPSNPQGAQFGAFGTWGTNYLIQAGSARSSTYGLRIVQSGANVFVASAPMSGATSLSCGMNVRVVSGSGVVTVAYLDASSSTLQLVYDVTNTKFGLRWGAGTPAYQSGTTPLNTWVWVDIRGRVNSSVWHGDWTLETGTNTYTAQTSPADLTGQSPTTFTSTSPLVLSTGASQTMTAEYDDVVISRYYSAYPVGPHTVKVLTVDTGGTPTVSGTTTNFSVFTANGTLAAWNATNARNAVDEVPPTISASADGVVQTAVAASDYMEFPMANPTLASDEAVGAVRAVIPTWGGTGSGTGTLGLRVSDGTTETQVDAGSVAYDGDSLTAASSTHPIWRTSLIPAPAVGWNSTRLNSLVTRVGYSSDATPDMGVRALYCEYAVKKLTPVRTLTVGEADEFKVDLYVNPYNSATVSYVITNDDTTRDVTFDYSISGTPQTPVVVGPSANSTLQLNADVFGDISDITLTPEVL